MTLVEIVNRAKLNCPIDEDGDYKDRASQLSSAIWDELTQIENRFEFRKLNREANKLGLLDGGSCPRAFWKGLEEIELQS